MRKILKVCSTSLTFKEIQIQQGFSAQHLSKMENHSSWKNDHPYTGG